MSPLGTESNPLHVAIVGAGPAGFYAAERLMKEKDFAVEVDMYERLPTPFGLVRYGVAPDHQKIKSVTAAFDRTAKRPNFHFYGNVEYGTDMTLDDLKKHYHQIIFTTGAQTDRMLDIPGEDLVGSYPATEFVAWYNGHPDFHDCQFDLTQEKVAVVGIGNVAIDVARILSLTPQELARTDMADYAIEALSKSNVKEVHILGRRGPAQAAFTPIEIKELGELEDCDIVILPEEAALDPLSEASLADADRNTVRDVEIVQELSAREPTGKSKTLYLRFLVSPTRIDGDDNGHVAGMELVHNELYKTDTGTLRPRATDVTEYLDVGIVFRSIGYRGVPLPGIPFHERWGVILNDQGRIVDSDTREPVVGLYTAGWIKRGPSGVIGTNKPDSAETVELMLEDARAGKVLQPSQPSLEETEADVHDHQPDFISYANWQKLDAYEVAQGKAADRPRIKVTDVADMLKIAEE
ncbi:MAG: FAD-dependent oxidoreductase [Chloroflexota bacterium]